jgi:hypothetical protein
LNGFTGFWTKLETLFDNRTFDQGPKVAGSASGRLEVKSNQTLSLYSSPKIKREARARRLHLPGWVGFVAGCPAEVFGLPRQDLSSKPAFKPVPRMFDDYHEGKTMSTLIILISEYRAGVLPWHSGALDFGIDLAPDQKRQSGHVEPD